MYLKRLAINNFRKFGTNENEISFVDANTYSNVKKSKANQTETLDEPAKSESSDETSQLEQINVASTTTLIVGKNNAGKSTITFVLDKLINNPASFKSLDFNINYLKETFSKLLTSPSDFKPPVFTIKMTIGFDDDSKDLVTNYIPFMSLDAAENQEIEILVKYEVVEEQELVGSLLKEMELYKAYDADQKFSKYIDILTDQDFSLNYYDSKGEKTSGFKIKDLIELKTVNAITVKNQSSLSRAFCKIIEYRYKEIAKGDRRKDLDDTIQKINKGLDKIIKAEHSDTINQSFEKMIASDKLKILLSSDLSFSRLFRDLIKYEYIDGENIIPEDQYGLGYTNLVTIVAELIDYMEQYGEAAFNSRVNLISIEEPETYMHPQMQEVFIRNINDAITFLLENRKKNINTQLIITTHSSHILNSKIHTGNSFNNINYVVGANGQSNNVVLSDAIICPTTSKDKKHNKARKRDLAFLKKHIKFKASDLFFADAVILVEGITEETLIQYHVTDDKTLSKYYITIFNIDGAHGLVYHHLLQLLKIPCLIITDIDIKRSDDEKKSYKQMQSLNSRVTTNKTIIKYNGSDALENISEKIQKQNLYVSYQGKLDQYYPTSFEEALILTNYNNTLLNRSLASVKPRIYAGVIGKAKKVDNLKQNSYKMQAKLSSSKSEFANTLLYNMINKESSEPNIELPKYIQDALDWLQQKLKGGK